MTTLHKAAVSLLISAILFGIFALFAFTRLFDILEARFYNPAIIEHATRDLSHNAEVAERFVADMQNLFTEALRTDEVKRIFLARQNESDILTSSNALSNLMEKFSGIQWIRFIDSGGSRLFYSSYGPDIMNQSTRIYRSYSEPDLPYERIAVEKDGDPKLIFDGSAERILFSFPAYDSFDVYCGTALFSVSIEPLWNQLINEGRIRTGQDIIVISNPQGLLFESPATGEEAMPSQISTIWSLEEEKTTRLFSAVSGIPLALLSIKTSYNFFVGRLVNEELLFLPFALKIILLLTFFLTIFLIVFLLFNIRKDPIVVIQNRIKELQISLIEQFYENKNEADWTRWIRELEFRKKEVSAQLKWNLNINSESENNDIDTLISKSWDELLAILGSRRETEITEEKFKSILTDIVATHTGSLTRQPFTPSPQTTGEISSARGGLLSKATAVLKGLDKTNEQEEILEELKEVEDLEELEEADEVETLEELVDVENITEESSIESLSLVDKDMNKDDLALLASEIEFGPDVETEIAEDDSLEGELEIVSPFSSMLSDLSDSSESVDDTENGESGLDAISECGIPLITKPFDSVSGARKIETLEITSEDEPESVTDEEDLIKEREGVPYISGKTTDSAVKTDQSLDRDFKKLVDSVIK